MPGARELVFAITTKLPVLRELSGDSAIFVAAVYNLAVYQESETKLHAPLQSMPLKPP
jgi:hypothetical protein